MAYRRVPQSRSAIEAMPELQSSLSLLKSALHFASVSTSTSIFARRSLSALQVAIEFRDVYGLKPQTLNPKP